MRVSVVDKLEIADRRVTNDGYLAVRANIARSGVYKYTRKEVGLTDGNPNELVGVYRSPEFVFDESSLATFAHRPVTLNHPSKDVNPKSWKKDAVGHIGGAVWQSDDKKHVVVDMLLMDESGITAANSTHRELSAGYSCDIEYQDGVSPEGEQYSAVMTGNYRANHVALVPAGRAGHTCRVGDSAWPIEDSVPPQKEARKMKIVYDGLTVDLSDEAAATAFAKKLADAKDAAVAVADAANKALADAEAKAATDLAAKDAKIATMDAEIASLKKSVEDAKVTPEQMREMAKAHSALTDAATKMGFTVTDAMSDAEIKKGAVLKVLGDSYAEKTEAFFDAAFEIESGKLKVADNGTDPYRVAMGDRKVADFNVNDEVAAARKAREDYIKSLSNPASAEAK